MARIRTIKPTYFTSEDIVGLTPLARLLYIAIWLEADREGRLEWRPRTLKLRYLPGDDCSVEDLSAELVNAGLVVPYEVDGQQLAYIPTFTKHQVINNREAPSELPPPHACTTREPRVPDACTTRDDASGTVKSGREGKGKEGREGASSTRGDSPKARSTPPKPKAKAKTQIPPDFVVSDRVRTWAGTKGYGDLDQHLEAFRAKCQAKGYTYVDWDSALMEAIRGDWAKLRVGGRTSSAVLHADDVFEATR